jgi:S1-C subfamily serine protease
MTGKIKVLAASAIFLMISIVSAKATTITTANPGIDEKKIEEIMKMVAPSVVKVEARNGIRKVATGVVIDKNGFIVTTALVSPRDEEISVITQDGKRIKAEFKGLDTQTQIGLIQAKDKGLTPIAMGKSSDLQPGAWIGVVGLSPENTPAITQGIISSVSPQSLRLNVWVVPGMSGSPVINGAGQMVGLLRGAYTDEQTVVFEFREQKIVGSGTVISRAEAPSSGMALAVPIDVVNSIASDLEKKGKVERGWLGVRVVETDGRLEVVVVEPKGPAELAKIKESDIILKIDGKDIMSGEALSSEIRSRKPGQDITVRIERDGKPMDIKVKLGEYTEEEARREQELSFPGLFPPRDTKPESRPRIIYARPKYPAPLPRGFVLEERKFIGVSLQPLNKDMADHYGIKDGIGLLVWEFAEDSPAKNAGLKAGDVILKADGKRVESVAALSEIIQGKKKGDKVKIEFVRDKKTMSLDVEIREEEIGPEDLFRSFQDFSLRMPDQIGKYDEQYQKQINEYFQKNQETLKKFTDEMNKKLKETGKYGRVIYVLGDSREIN